MIVANVGLLSSGFDSRRLHQSSAYKRALPVAGEGEWIVHSLASFKRRERLRGDRTGLPGLTVYRDMNLDSLFELQLVHKTFQSLSKDDGGSLSPAVFQGMGLKYQWEKS
jgi:hypothetical protein